MMTVKDVSNLTGVSIRTLQYYDKIGLLHPAHRTQAGYRLYDEAALERLQQILLFRELEFSLEDIRKILKNPEFDREKALEQQITLLTLKKQHLEKLIALAERFGQQEEMLWTSTHLTHRRSGNTQNVQRKSGAKPQSIRNLRQKTPSGRRRNLAASTSS